MVAFTAEADLLTGWCLFGLALLVGGINQDFGFPFISLPVSFAADEASPRSRRLWGEIVSGEAVEFMLGTGPGFTLWERAALCPARLTPRVNLAETEAVVVKVVLESACVAAGVQPVQRSGDSPPLSWVSGASCAAPKPNRVVFSPHLEKRNIKYTT